MTAESRATIGDQIRASGDEARALRSEVADIASDLRQLLQMEAELAQAEVAEARGFATRGAAFGTGAVVMGLIASFFLFLTLMFALDTFMPLWLAALITFGVVAVLAILLAASSLQQVKRFSPTPKRFMRSVREDMEWAKRQMKSSVK